MRALGLDLGTKRIGVAVSDELGSIAHPLTVVERRGPRVDVERIARLASEHEVGVIVMGLPLNLDGSEGPMAQSARDFGDSLAKFSPCTVEYWDERLTTVAAERALLEADVSRARRKKVVDKVAAALILQGWLDARTPSALPEED